MTLFSADTKNPSCFIGDYRFTNYDAMIRSLTSLFSSQVNVLVGSQYSYPHPAKRVRKNVEAHEKFLYIML